MVLSGGLRFIPLLEKRNEDNPEKPENQENQENQEE
jgi:hypothetical protein